VVDPVHRQAYFNTYAVVAVANGDLAQVHAMDTSPQTADNRTLALVFSISRLYVAIALLREGDPIRVEELLHSALAHAERTQGRRSTVACLHAVAMAAALLERNEIARAQAILAHRVDVMERFVFPDAILLAYETLVRLAVAQGDERRGGYSTAWGSMVTPVRCHGSYSPALRCASTCTHARGTPSRRRC
jgi:LuxR family maltose regulon positive regulatory protein